MRQFRLALAAVMTSLTLITSLSTTTRPRGLVPRNPRGQIKLDGHDPGFHLAKMIGSGLSLSYSTNQPSSLEEYRLESIVAETGNAVVYAGKSLHDGQTYAIKAMNTTSRTSNAAELNIATPAEEYAMHWKALGENSSPHHTLWDFGSQSSLVSFTISSWNTAPKVTCSNESRQTTIMEMMGR